MRTLYKALIVTMLLTILLSTPILRADEGNTNIGIHEDNNGNITIQTGNLTAIFDGQKPSLRFYYSTNARQVYYVKFNSLTEFNDTTHTFVFYHNESLQTASLEEANWTHSQFFNTTDGATAINFTTHQLNIVQIGHEQDYSWNQSNHLSNTTVTLTAKLYPNNTDRTVKVGNATFTIHGGVEIKLDISINKWPFINTNDRLALRIDLHTSVNEFEISEHDGDHEVNTNQTEHSNETNTSDTTPSPVSQNIAPLNETHTNDTDHEISEHQGEGQVQLLTANGLVGGFFRFVSNAKTDGNPTAVAASYRFEPDEVNASQHEFKLYLSYHSFNTSLVHDPSFGVNSVSAGQSLPVFAAVSLLVVGVMSAAAVLVARRRRILL